MQPLHDPARPSGNYPQAPATQRPQASKSGRDPHALWPASPGRGVCRLAMLTSWLCMALVSLDHLVPFCSWCARLTTWQTGILGWTTAVLTLFCLGRGMRRALGAVMLVFLVLGFLIGPYLEPPADPLEHLRRVHEEVCGKNLGQVAASNRGLWHYSMAGLVLCTRAAQVRPQRMLNKIRLAQGLFWALAAGGLFFSSRLTGLTRRWAIFALVCCFLFFGTNRFGYFRYYSLAPSLTSMVIYWLWAGYFFLRSGWRQLALAAGTGALFLPVLWVNHRQEGVFMLLLFLILLLVNIFHSLAPLHSPDSSGTGRRARLFFIALCLGLFWVLPQSEGFRHWLSGLSVRSLGRDYYQFTWFSWHGIYLGGNPHAWRVPDTLGAMGAAMGILAAPYFWPGLIRMPLSLKVRIYILAVIPFLAYGIPLLHLIWASNVYVAEYYRLCYASMFWLFFAHLLAGMEPHCCGWTARLLRLRADQAP